MESEQKDGRQPRLRDGHRTASAPASSPLGPAPHSAQSSEMGFGFRVSGLVRAAARCFERLCPQPINALGLLPGVGACTLMYIASTWK